ncbi:MAG: MoxR family ATPase [Phycisphaerales bacterium]|nr:MoxR family ATPase [Phycisphaerales bacterium]
MSDNHTNQHSGKAQAGEEMLAMVRETQDSLKAEINKVIVGQEEVVDQILIAIFSRGHAMLVGVPGLAKTLLISTIAQAMDLKFSRIQFTPDLMPSDITGTEVIEEDKATGHRSLRFVKGPVFGNVVLADEINRTPPKTQAAMLEAMQERQVTIGGEQHTLPSPFFVLATQNPLEQEGTYPLPEAQLDRFMLQVMVGYPSEQEELEVMRRSSTKGEVEVSRIVNAQQIEQVQRIIQHAPVSDHVLRYALRLARSTRAHESEQVPEIVRDYIAWGAGPRASEALIQGAKAHALLIGSGIVGIDSVRAVAHPVLRHRILTNFNAQADQITPDMIVDQLLSEVSQDSMSKADKSLTQRAIRS